MKNKVLGLGVFLFLALTAWCNASSQIATVTKVEGEVVLLTHPSPGVEGPSPRVLFENQYYTSAALKVGEKIQKGSILRTPPNGRVQLIYENGDQIYVGPATSYRVSWSEGGEKPRMEMRYGNIRSIIAKSGPRSGLQIRTRSATMGVRGTDFYVEQTTPQSETKVAVLRGKVEVRPQDAPQVVKTVDRGFTAQVAAAASESKGESKPKAPVAVVAIVPTNRTELLVIQRTSQIKQLVQEEARAPAAVQKEVETLEKKASQMVVADIKASDPKLYAQLQLDSQKTVPVEAINSTVVKTQFKEAPKGPPLSKPLEDELRRYEEDPYGKYFKIND